MIVFPMRSRHAHAYMHIIVEHVCVMNGLPPKENPFARVTEVTLSMDMLS